MPSIFYVRNGPQSHLSSDYVIALLWAGLDKVCFLYTTASEYAVERQFFWNQR